MALDDFFDRIDADPHSLVVINRSVPRPFQRLLEQAFGGQPVAVEEEQIPGRGDDLVALVTENDGGREVVATSPLEALTDTILMVNSDLYMTGTVGLEEFELPEVLVGLHDIPFRLRGYPESNKEKLLLIVISRYIERWAWQAGRGTLRTSFQRLSRIRDERGTRAVYETVADSDVQTHVYGVPDWQPPPEFGVVAHGGYTDEFRRSWFVVYTPPEDGDIDCENPHLALLALEVGPWEWKGFWTFDRSLVTDLNEYITRTL